MDVTQLDAYMKKLGYYNKSELNKEINKKIW
jgi:hypothetical protein